VRLATAGESVLAAASAVAAGTDFVDVASVQGADAETVSESWRKYIESIQEESALGDASPGARGL
jgi:hypothetical protein